MPDFMLPHHHGESAQTAQIQEALKNIYDFQTVADIFKQLGDTTRIRIFWLLCHCEECVINISAMLKMSSPAVSHHLRPLKNSGLIVSRRDGKEVYYRAADTAQSRLLHQMIELVMQVSCPKPEASFGLEAGSGQGSGDCPVDQAAIARRIHEHLICHMDQRITIEDLSRQYLINPTSLKSAFKSVYGTSIAAHIREHRMEEAARLLRETSLSAAEIAKAVGYGSQSRFTGAFKDFFGVLPTEYRKGR